MKRKLLLLLCCLTVIFTQKITAQSEFPEASTADKPVWYYIQVKGTDTRKGRILSAALSSVTGKYLEDITPSQRNSCLWRFEKTGDAYTIINKSYSIHKLDTTYSTTHRSNIITLKTAASSTLTWTFESYNDFWLIKSSTGLYIFQGAAAMDYVVISSAYGASDNGSFSFLKYEDTPPEVSDTKDVWYYIYSAQTGNTDKCITDTKAAAGNEIKFSLTPKSTDSIAMEAQQWKMIQPENATNNNVLFVNRATGNIIQTEYDYNGYFNATSTTDPENSNGWALTFINLNQFKISGLNADGDTGYLNVSSLQEEASSIPLENDFFNSAYAWTFEPVDRITSMDQPEDPFADSSVRVRVENRRIIVEGTDDYSVYHVSGIQVEKEIELPVGVYLVSIDGHTKAYLVK